MMAMLSSGIDGSLSVVPDEVGQIYIFGTGPGMAKKDAKHDQETQLPPHQRTFKTCYGIQVCAVSYLLSHLARM
jgi:hypothetical protein